MAGELLDAEMATYTDYKDLLMSCPCCESPVFLCKGFDRTTKKGKVVKVLSAWKHFPDKVIGNVAECEARTHYRPQDVEQKNSVARKQRFKFYRQRIWELIGESPFIKRDTINGHIHRTLEQGDIRWFVEELYNRLRSPDIQNSLKYGLEAIIDEVLNDDSSNNIESVRYIVKNILLSDRNLGYRKTIALESLIFCCKNWSHNDLLKLATLATSKESQDDIAKWCQSIVRKIVQNTPVDVGMKTLQIWKLDEHKAMTLIHNWILSNPAVNDKYAEQLATLSIHAVKNLLIIFLSIPWLDEFKKFSKELN
ncbi:MAG: hypothetical protein WBA93_09295 [Microcoleaceae cyanobacterium]